MADLGVILRNGQLVASANVIAAVQLGRWSGTAVASLTADNVFDDSLYSSYLITGQFRPATNGANFSAVLRSSAPADVGGGLFNGQLYSRAGSTSSGGGSSNALQASVNSTSGIVKFTMTLPGLPITGSGVFPFSIDAFLVQTDNNWYAYKSGGMFLDGTPRQGIKFLFSSGNIASGWFEIIGIKKQ